ncbi:Sigma-X negative effector [Paraliobacillus sp. PM-2]|uniref:hypothetical protein n=1 Tax=Paraliobacillus sp. PM-2 TaxID=1462524 RepID=UPI00061C950A|nr:hypothetical protein [Paraliobacillus sp. PM-2]CQR46723.1 Sigma-X negative effector [Paraliobacillus sp. PM-2]
MDNEQTKQLEEKLKKMPTITDNQSKDMLYQKIENRMESKQVSRRWSWVIPSFASVVVIALLFIIIQDNMNHSFQNADQSKSQDMVMEQAENDSAKLKQQEEKSDALNNEQDATKNDDAVQQFTMTNEETDSSMIYYKQVEQERLYTIASVDKYSNQAIPITLIDPSSSGDPNVYYNRINSFFSEEQKAAFGINQFPFKGLTFNVSLDEKQVLMTVAKDYSFPEGSSLPHVFEQMLTIMFKPLGFDEVIVQSEDGGPVNLGPFGNIDAFSLGETNRFIYKIYQYEDNKQLLVPTHTGQNNTIETALKAMQRDEPAFDIDGPIPEDVTYELSINQDNLTIRFSDGSSLGNNHSTASMIEAILMTAKSYDFQSISIDLPVNIKAVKDYALNEKIPVPDGVNPIILH